MAVQDALATILEYNAAMELPYSAVLGIDAFLSDPPVRDNSLAESELRMCSELCGIAERSLAGDLASAGPENAYLYSAFQRLFRDPSDRNRFRTVCKDAQSAFDNVIKALHGEPADPPNTDALRRLQAEMRELADRIKREIPREESLASLTGTIHPVLASR